LETAQGGRAGDTNGAGELARWRNSAMARLRGGRADTEGQGAGTISALPNGLSDAKEEVDGGKDIATAGLRQMETGISGRANCWKAKRRSFVHMEGAAAAEVRRQDDGGWSVCGIGPCGGSRRRSFDTKGGPIARFHFLRPQGV